MRQGAQTGAACNVHTLLGAVGLQCCARLYGAIDSGVSRELYPFERAAERIFA